MIIPNRDRPSTSTLLVLTAASVSLGVQDERRRIEKANEDAFRDFLKQMAKESEINMDSRWRVRPTPIYRIIAYVWRPGGVVLTSLV